MRKSVELPPPVWARKDNPEPLKPNWEALWVWAKDKERKPPVLAFTAGLERDIADLVWFVMMRERERCAEIADRFTGLRSSLQADVIAEMIQKRIQGKK